MFCPKCGKQLKDGAKFCSNCGAKIQAVAPKVEPVQQPVPEKVEAATEDVTAVETANVKAACAEKAKADIPIMQVPPMPEMTEKPEMKPVQQEPVHHKMLETHNEFLKTKTQSEEKPEVKEAPAKKSGGITTILTIVFLLLAAGITAGSFAYTRMAQGPLEPITLEKVKAEEDDGAENTDSEEADTEVAEAATEAAGK